VVRELLAEAVREPSETTAAHAEREVLALDVGGADLGSIWGASDDRLAYIYYPTRRVASGRRGARLALVYLHDLSVIDLAPKRPINGVLVGAESV
jgi:hypothetical protein